MKRQSIGFCSVVIDEVGPFHGVFLKALVTKLLKDRFVELIDIYDRGAVSSNSALNCAISKACYSSSDK